MAVCWACQRPVDPSRARRGIDGELYHPNHVRTARNFEYVDT